MRERHTHVVVDSEAKALEHLRIVFLLRDALTPESVPEVEKEIYRLSMKLGQIA